MLTSGAGAHRRTPGCKEILKPSPSSSQLILVLSKLKTLLHLWFTRTKCARIGFYYWEFIETTAEKIEPKTTMENIAEVFASNG